MKGMHPGFRDRLVYDIDMNIIISMFSCVISMEDAYREQIGACVRQHG